ncbi:MAG TPA: lipase maturation factor family protein [Iamia sp.]
MGDWLGRLLFQRGLAGIYVLAFLGSALQFRALLGDRGIMPIRRYVAAVPFRRAPSLFHLAYSDGLFAAVSWLGVAVSAALLLGLGDIVPLPATMALWAIPWALYLSIVNVGQRWYSFGWEVLLCEAGFLAIFLGPADMAPPVLVLWLLRWLLLRLELGAGLIKLRGDPCWRDLTCLRYHHETQPLPGPLSWWFHRLPDGLHRVEVAANHVTQLVAPLFLLAPQPYAGVAALVMVVTQLWLMISGNFAWLNAVTIVIALPALGGWLLGPIVPVDPPALADPPVWHAATVLALTAVVVALSARPVRNLVAPRGRQKMNASFDPLRLVNTYGAFGSITRERREIVIEGRRHPDDDWQEYAFKAKPGDPLRRPRQVAPYHLRLDWLMWFAALAPSQHERWLRPLLVRLLRADPDVRRLLGHDPFGDDPPRWVRARMYRYRFTTRAERRDTGAWWVRTPVGIVIRPIRLREDANSVE